MDFKSMIEQMVKTEVQKTLTQIFSGTVTEAPKTRKPWTRRAKVVKTKRMGRPPGTKNKTDKASKQA